VNLTENPPFHLGCRAVQRWEQLFSPAELKKKTLHFLWSYHERPCCSCNCAPRRCLGAHSLQFSKSYIYEECEGSLSTNFKEANYLLFTFGKYGLIIKCSSKYEQQPIEHLLLKLADSPQRKGCFSYWLLLRRRVQRFIRTSSQFFLFSFLKNAGLK
jgi:hypothetical protein